MSGRDDEITELLAALVARPSINPEQRGPRADPPYGEGRVADFVQRYLGQAGLAAERQEVFPGRDNLIVRAAGSDAEAPPLLLEAHMDTVDVDGMPDPFNPRVEDGRLYGRGSCDTKASLAAMVFALRRIASQRVPLRQSVWLVASADEEYGQTGIRRLVDSGVRPAAAVVGEPTSLRVVAAHKGQVYLKIATRGRAAHTSVPERGHNAIYDMAEVIRVLRDRAATELPPRAHPLCGPPLYSVSIVEGGVSEHIVPERCEIALDLRTTPGQSGASAVAELRRWLDADLPPAVAARVSFAAPHQDCPPMETATGHPLVQGLARAVRAVTGSAEITGVSYNTDAGALAAAGVPVVVFGPGDIAHAHTTGERVELDEVRAAAATLERFILEQAG